MYVSVCVCVYELTQEHCAFEGQRVMSMDTHYLILFIQVLSLNLEGPYQLNSLARNPGFGLFLPPLILSDYKCTTSSFLSWC